MTEADLRKINDNVRNSISSLSNRLQDAYWIYIKEKTSVRENLGREISSSQTNNYSELQTYFHESNLIPFKIFPSALELFIRTHEFSYTSNRESRTVKIRKALYKNKAPKKDTFPDWEPHFSKYILNILDVRVDFSALIGKPSKDYLSVSLGIIINIIILLLKLLSF